MTKKRSSRKTGKWNQ